jgi:predicted acetyltransferase
VGDGQRRVRNLESDDDVRGFLRCMRTGFLSDKDVKDDAVRWARDRWDLSRAWSAFDDGVQCGTARTFGSRLRLPGLGDAPVSCLTQVTVLPTHTRRGHLSSMMRTQLLHAVEAGEVASLLVAAEWPIYGRFGYGPYGDWVEWEVDTQVASIVGSPVGSCELVDAAALEKAALHVLARQQAVTPGSIERPPWFTAMTTGADPRPEEKREGRIRVVHRDADGEPDAYALYDPKERWDGMRPTNRIEVEDLVAASPQAERELWRYLVDVDLVDVVKWGGSPNSVLRWCMADGRAARAEGRWDHIWARPLDVAACLAARSYASSGRVVVELVDGFLGVASGSYVLDATPDGASCERTDEPADVTLDVAALGAAWLGGVDLRVAAAGGGRWSVDEHRAGALASLAALLRWHEDPYCSTDF